MFHKDINLKSSRTVSNKARASIKNLYVIVIMALERSVAAQCARSAVKCSLMIYLRRPLHSPFSLPLSSRLDIISEPQFGLSIKSCIREDLGSTLFIYSLAKYLLVRGFNKRLFFWDLIGTMPIEESVASARRSADGSSALAPLIAITARRHSL